jgi:hypothetical protein
MRASLRLILVALVLLFVPSAAFADPTVTLSPVVGPPTTKVVVTGSGFGPFMPVDIYFDSGDLCLAIAKQRSPESK